MHRNSHYHSGLRFRRGRPNGHMCPLQGTEPSPSCRNLNRWSLLRVHLRSDVTVCVTSLLLQPTWTTPPSSRCEGCKLPARVRSTSLRKSVNGWSRTIAKRHLSPSLFLICVGSTTDFDPRRRELRHRRVSFALRPEGTTVPGLRVYHIQSLASAD